MYTYYIVSIIPSCGKLENLSSRIDMHTHANSAVAVWPWPCDLGLWPFDLTADACRTTAMLYIYRIWYLVSIAQVVFLLERRQKKTGKANDYPIRRPRRPPAWLYWRLSKLRTCKYHVVPFYNNAQVSHRSTDRNRKWTAQWRESQAWRHVARDHSDQWPLVVSTRSYNSSDGRAAPRRICIDDGSAS